MKTFSIEAKIRPNERNNLTQTEREHFDSLLIANSNLFQKRKKPTKYIQHRIGTCEHRPISVVPYRLSLFRKTQLHTKKNSRNFH